MAAIIGVIFTAVVIVELAKLDFDRCLHKHGCETAKRKKS